MSLCNVTELFVLFDLDSSRARGVQGASAGACAETAHVDVLDASKLGDIGHRRLVDDDDLLLSRLCPRRRLPPPSFVSATVSLLPP